MKGNNYLKHWWRLALLTTLAVLGAACAHSMEGGRPFDVEASNQIEIGKTTEAEVLALLGEPLLRQSKEDGSKVYGYKYIKAKAYLTSPVTMKAESAGDKLIIGFNNKGIVTAIERTAMPGNKAVKQ